MSQPGVQLVPLNPPPAVAAFQPQPQPPVVDHRTSETMMKVSKVSALVGGLGLVISLILALSNQQHVAVMLSEISGIGAGGVALLLYFGNRAWQLKTKESVAEGISALIALLIAATGATLASYGYSDLGVIFGVSAVAFIAIFIPLSRIGDRHQRNV